MGARLTGMDQLLGELRKAEIGVVDATKKVVGRGCMNIKKQAQATIRGAGHRGYLPHYPRAIGYEVSGGADLISGQVGPDNARLQGGLGRLIEFGSINNAPIPHMGPALDAEEPRFADAMEQMAAALLDGQVPAAAGPVVDPGGG